MNWPSNERNASYIIGAFNFVEIQRKSQNEYENICIFNNMNNLKLLSNCKGK